MKRSLCLLAAALHVAGCTTLRSVPYSPGTFESNPVRAGDKVVLATAGGERRLEVTSVTPAQICGAGECVRTEEIHGIQREELDVLKTVVLVAAIALVAAGAGAAASYRPVARTTRTCFFCP
jgi:hypothetical protein